MSPVPARLGIYVVSLTNEIPISVNADRPKIAERCISVNRDNCKYGKAVNLARRKRDYQKTFGAQNVVFKVVVVSSNIDEIESHLGRRLNAYRIRGATGKPNEWLQGIAASEVEQILNDVIKELAAGGASATPTSHTRSPALSGSHPARSEK